MELVLHIGHAKTGTTSIQKSLSLSSSYLRKLNVSLSHFSESGNDRVVPAMFSKSDEMYALFGIREERRQAIQNVHKSQFEKYLKKLRPDTKLILSSEQFTLGLNTQEEVSELAAFLRGHFEKITIVIYLRNQASFHEAAYWETLKAGFSNPFDLEPQASIINSSLYNYRKLLENWELAFDKENIKVLSYDQLINKSEDIVDSFFRAVSSAFGVEIDFLKVTKSKRENSSPGSFFLEALRQVNHQLILGNPGFSDKPYLIESLFRRDIINFINDLSSVGPNTRLDRNVWYQVFKESNEYVENRYLKKQQIFLEASLDIPGYIQSGAFLTRIKMESCKGRCIESIFSPYTVISVNRKLGIPTRIWRGLKKRLKKEIFIRRFTSNIFLLRLIICVGRFLKI